jgi:hypothetical protein
MDAATASDAVPVRNSGGEEIHAERHFVGDSSWLTSSRVISEQGPLRNSVEYQASPDRTSRHALLLSRIPHFPFMQQGRPATKVVRLRSPDAECPLSTFANVGSSVPFRIRSDTGS